MGGRQDRNHIADLLSALLYFVPSIQGCVNASWRIHSAWPQNELPACCCLHELTLHEHRMESGLLQLRITNIMMNDQLTFATFNLPDTINNLRGITDAFSKTDQLSLIS